jgi:hypothetical protein
MHAELPVAVERWAGGSAAPEATEYQRHFGWCEGRECFTQAELPEGVPKGAFGPRLMALSWNRNLRSFTWLELGATTTHERQQAAWVAHLLPGGWAAPAGRTTGTRVWRFVLAEPRSFVRPDGRLDFERLLREFADFWREHGEVLAAGMSYHEVAPPLVLMAFLQRVINGGGYVDREYGVGRGRMDLLVRWPFLEGGQRHWQRHALELKIWREGAEDPLARGLAQLDGYLERLGLEEGVLVIFDRRPEVGDLEQRTRFEQARTPSGCPVTVLRA